VVFHVDTRDALAAVAGGDSDFGERYGIGPRGAELCRGGGAAAEATAGGGQAGGGQILAAADWAAGAGFVAGDAQAAADRGAGDDGAGLGGFERGRIGAVAGADILGRAAEIAAERYGAVRVGLAVELGDGGALGLARGEIVGGARIDLTGNGGLVAAFVAGDADGAADEGAGDGKAGCGAGLADLGAAGEGGVGGFGVDVRRAGDGALGAAVVAGDLLAAADAGAGDTGRGRGELGGVRGRCIGGLGRPGSDAGDELVTGCGPATAGCVPGRLASRKPLRVRSAGGGSAALPAERARRRAMAASRPELGLAMAAGLSGRRRGRR
jgi:hypothetical protein